MKRQVVMLVMGAGAGRGLQRSRVGSRSGGERKDGRSVEELAGMVRVEEKGRRN